MDKNFGRILDGVWGCLPVESDWFGKSISNCWANQVSAFQTVVAKFTNNIGRILDGVWRRVPVECDWFAIFARIKLLPNFVPAFDLEALNYTKRFFFILPHAMMEIVPNAFFIYFYLVIRDDGNYTKAFLPTRDDGNYTKRFYPATAMGWQWYISDSKFWQHIFITYFDNIFCSKGTAFWELDIFKWRKNFNFTVGSKNACREIAL